MATYGLKLFAGNSNLELAQQICSNLEIPLGRALVTTFSDGETRIEIQENVRGADIFVVQSGAHPVNDHLMELLVMIDAMKRASARRITAVIPYYSYARQDRKNKPRVPITARLVADLITRAGAHRILTMDLHAGQIRGFSIFPWTIFMPPLFFFLTSASISTTTWSSFHRTPGAFPGPGLMPDASRPAWRSSTTSLGCQRGGGFEHHRGGGRENGVVLDDMVDTAGTLVEATRSLMDKGAREVHACVTHAVLSGPAVQRIEESSLKSLWSRTLFP